MDYGGKRDSRDLRKCLISGASARTRTVNQLIKSQLLYQLSYRGIMFVMTRNFLRQGDS